MMKNFYYLVLTAFTVTSLVGCSGKAEQEAGALDYDENTTASQVRKEAQKESPAVSIWDKISVKDNPGKKGKWLTSLSVGESLTFLNETQVDSSDENKTYIKVRLNDGKEGWTRSDFVVPDAKAGVFTQEATIYKRPDLLTKSDVTFSKMDIVAVTETQDDWLKIRGKRTGGTWIDEGWIKASNISYEPTDIATA